MPIALLPRHFLQSTSAFAIGSSRTRSVVRTSTTSFASTTSIGFRTRSSTQRTENEAFGSMRWLTSADNRATGAAASDHAERACRQGLPRTDPEQTVNNVMPHKGHSANMTRGPITPSAWPRSEVGRGADSARAPHAASACVAPPSLAPSSLWASSPSSRRTTATGIVAVASTARATLPRPPASGWPAPRAPSRMSSQP